MLRRLGLLCTPKNHDVVAGVALARNRSG
jgi:hypothetical protein